MSSTRTDAIYVILRSPLHSRSRSPLYTLCPFHIFVECRSRSSIFPKDPPTASVPLAHVFPFTISRLQSDPVVTKYSVEYAKQISIICHVAVLLGERKADNDLAAISLVIGAEHGETAGCEGSSLT